MLHRGITVSIALLVALRARMSRESKCAICRVAVRALRSIKPRNAGPLPRRAIAPARLRRVLVERMAALACRALRMIRRRILAIGLAVTLLI